MNSKLCYERARVFSFFPNRDSAWSRSVSNAREVKEMCLKYTTKICQFIGGMVLRGYLSHRDSKPEAATQVSAANNLSQDGYGNASGWLLNIYYTIHKQQNIRDT